MIIVEEQEKKYLISNVSKSTLWDKEHIVYQWYVSADENTHTKEKIIFDLLRARVIYVRISKISTGYGKNKKNVEYLDINNFKSTQMIGLPFILKRRSIKSKLFLDRMIRSNNLCKYLLEDEGDEVNENVSDEFCLNQEVTHDRRFYNQNMCTEFTEHDARQLDFLLSVF